MSLPYHLITIIKLPHNHFSHTHTHTQILISLFLLVGIQSLVFIALLVICCLVQASNQRSLQRELQSLRTTFVQLLSQQSTTQQNGRISPLILLNQQTQNCTSRVDDGLTTSVSLPSLHERGVVQLTPPPHGNDGVSVYHTASLWCNVIHTVNCVLCMFGTGVESC